MTVKRRIDFTYTSDGIQPLPAGEYVMHVFDVADKSSKDGAPGVNVTLKVAEEGEYKGRTIFYYLSEREGALWKVRGFLEACGAQIPKKAVMVDYGKCLGKTLIATLSTRDYNGRTVNDVTAVRLPIEGDATGDSGNDEEEIPF